LYKSDVDEIQLEEVSSRVKQLMDGIQESKKKLKEHAELQPKKEERERIESLLALHNKTKYSSFFRNQSQIDADYCRKSEEAIHGRKAGVEKKVR